MIEEIVSSGIDAQLGCQVGETGILAAAGRQLAASRKMLYLEGSYSNYLLKEDIVNEPVEFGSGGVAQPLTGDGLGISINEDTLQRLTVMHQEIKLQDLHGDAVKRRRQENRDRQLIALSTH